MAASPSSDVIPSFSFSQLSQHSQLSLAARMSHNSLLDFSESCSSFADYLSGNLNDVVLACLNAQYGYCPNLVYEPSLKPIFAAALLDPDESCLLEDRPVLQLLLMEERLNKLPEHRRLMELLTSSTGGPLTHDDQDMLYGPGVRGLLRYTMRYNALIRHVHGSEARWRHMQRFLEATYTPWGIGEIAGVYEILCDIIVSRLGGAACGDEDLDATCAHLIAGLDILNLPLGGVRDWILEKQAERNAEAGGADVKNEHRWFFLKPPSIRDPTYVLGRGVSAWSTPRAGDDGAFAADWDVPRSMLRTTKVPGAKVRETKTEKPWEFARITALIRGRCSMTC